VTLTVYRPSRDADLLVSQWWCCMDRDGDLDLTFSGDSRAMGSLFRMVSPPKALVYTCDDEGIWFAMWFERVLAGSFFGQWVRRGRRGTRAALDTTFEAWALAFAQGWNPLIAVTKQERLLRELGKFGYTIHGPVPGLFDGDAAHIAVLTRDEFTKACERFRRVPVEG